MLPGTALSETQAMLQGSLVVRCGGGFGIMGCMSTSRLLFPQYNYELCTHFDVSIARLGPPHLADTSSFGPVLPFVVAQFDPVHRFLPAFICLSWTHDAPGQLHRIEEPRHCCFSRGSLLSEALPQAVDKASCAISLPQGRPSLCWDVSQPGEPSFGGCPSKGIAVIHDT